MRSWVAGAVMLALLGFVSALGLALLASGKREINGASEAVATVAEHRGAAADFVGAHQCVDCHAAQHAQWFASHHRMSMMEPSEATVRGDFDDATFTHFGVTTRFHRKRDEEGELGWYVTTENAEGELIEYRIAYTFGVTPLQQYLIAFPGGRLQTLPIAWDDLKKRWYHVYGDEHIPPGDDLFWTGRLQNWNYMCASCHSTNVKKNYDIATDTYRTTYSEINVSCEACHGPASKHLTWAKATPDQQQRFANRGFAVDLANADPTYELDACAPCHARRETISDDYVHGERFLDHFVPTLLVEPLYHADGQILDEVFEYGSFSQSRMHEMHVRCSNCHDPHALTLKQPGNALCMQCHSGFYDTQWHHMHEQGGAGSSCVDCHMPGRHYMGIDFRRDHNFRVPRPDLTVRLGADAAPNACNNCHGDRSAQWAVDALASWFGRERPARWHYAEAFAAARNGDPQAVALLLRVVTDERQPAIVLATALHELGERDDARGREAALRALGDNAPLVRATAARALSSLEPDARVEALAPLLDDEVRAVRIAAVRSLASAPLSLYTAQQRRAFDAALAEYAASQLELADQPQARFNLAVLAADVGRPDQAERWYRSTLALEPTFAPALVNLATLHSARGRPREAEQLLRNAIAVNPALGEAHYSLGLLLAEERQRLPDAAEHLRRAADRMPDHARVHYNLGLALQHLDRRDEAERALLRAAALDPESPDHAHALAIFYIQARQWDDARRYARQLNALLPHAPQVRQLLDHIERQSQP